MLLLDLPEEVLRAVLGGADAATLGRLACTGRAAKDAVLGPRGRCLWHQLCVTEWFGRDARVELRAQDIAYTDVLRWMKRQPEAARPRFSPQASCLETEGKESFGTDSEGFTWFRPGQTQVQLGGDRCCRHPRVMRVPLEMAIFGRQDEHGNVEVNERGEVLMVCTNQRVAYFETTLRARPGAMRRTEGSFWKECIVVGFATPRHRLRGVMPGWDRHALGWHSDDGGFFFHSINPQHDLVQRFGPEDTVGIGLRVLSASNHKGATTGDSENAPAEMDWALALDPSAAHGSGTSSDALSSSEDEGSGSESGEYEAEEEDLEHEFDDSDDDSDDDFVFIHTRAMHRGSEPTYTVELFFTRNGALLDGPKGRQLTLSQHAWREFHPVIGVDSGDGFKLSLDAFRFDLQAHLAAAGS